MKRMLFNATQAEELRVAIVDGQKLIDLDIESATKEQRKGNIYKAVITRLEPSLEAAFVDYGGERHGFLPFKEVSRAYFKSDGEPGKARIQEALHVGQELIVQVDKDERGTKGAALTTFISLAGRYLVLMPNNPRGGGVSRRVEGEDRQELRDIMERLEVPGGASLIARTAGIGRSLEELQWDLNYLLQLWAAIEGAANSQKGAFLIYQESSLVIRAIRDYFHPEIGEILIDTDDVFEQAQQFMAHVMPANVQRVKRYRDDVPLFSRFQIEHQIESAYARQVALPSGGAIVIDHTEALVSVDVNSGRATRGADIEETAYKTNLEAADETARQLRLRDLGGLIVVDFIDMESARNQREVENRLRDALRLDRARVQTSKISRFGLLELSRQRLRPALAETSYIPCPRCSGTGHIRSTESSALHILRILEEEAMKENTGALHCQVPVDVATFLLNEKRVDIAKLEMRHKVNLILIPNVHLETPQHQILRLRHDQLNQEETALPSYRMVEAPAEEGYTPASAQTESRPARQEAAVKAIALGKPAPVIEPRAKAPKGAARYPAPRRGMLSRILSWLSGDDQQEPTPAAGVRKEGEAPARRRTRAETGRGEARSDGRRGGRTRREGSEQPRARNEAASEKAAGPREARRGRGEKRDERAEPREAKPAREPRPPRAPRRPQAEAAPAASPAGAEAAAAAPTGEETQRPRRSRRGGRRERRPSEESATPVAETALPVADTEVPAAEIAAPVAQTVVPAAETVIPAAEPSVAAAEPVVSDTEVAVATVVPVVETEVADESISAATIPLAAEQPIEPVPAFIPPAAAAEERMEPVATEPAALDEAAPLALAEAPFAEPPATPEVEPAPAEPRDLSASLEQAGLVLIETSGDKAPPQVDVPSPPLGRKPRPVPVVVEEPLQMVETKRD